MSGPSGSSGGPQLNPDLARRLAILGAIILAALGLLLLRLWFLQVIGGASFESQAAENRIREVSIDAPRGNILDRKGRPLVQNRIAENVVIHPQELPEVHEERVLQQLSRTLKIPVGELQEVLKTGREASGVEPITIAEDVNAQVQAYVAERRRQLPGVALDRSYVRDYPQGTTAAHVVGYVQPIPADDIDTYLNRGYQRDERVGVYGLEKQYERYLRGRAGTRRYEVDRSGDITDRGNVSLTPPRPGNDLRLTIDLDVQKVLEDQLQARVKISGSSEAAAGVVLDPSNGDAFARNQQKRIRGFDRLNQAYFNRAIQGTYPAASTFKPITAIAALQAGFIEADTLIGSPAEIVLYNQKFKNYGDLYFGEIGLRQALMYSADTYFYSVGSKFWEDKQRPELLQDWAKKFGLGTPTGIDLGGEAGGLVADEEWKKEQPRSVFGGQGWLPGDTIQMSIGQNLLTATPLQMGVAYSAIANDGKVVTPSLVKSVENQGGARLLDRSRGRRVRALGASQGYIDAVKDGLYMVTNDFDGTASGVFQTLPEAVKAAGKTGTAEVPPRPDHSWFVGYAPFFAPKVVVAIVVENGGTGANAAAPAVCQVMAVSLAFDSESCGVGARAN
jgi:penicillin-binding protein 2